MKKKVFELNKQCLNMIPQISELFHKQMFFEGNKKTVKLIENLGEVSKYILSEQPSGLESQEWTQILTTILDAQQNKDYILLADVLECDMLPFLRKTQIYLQVNEEIDIDVYWEKNMQCIKQMDANLYQRLMQDDVVQDRGVLEYQPEITINGQVTLKVRKGQKEFCMHSTVNPEWEAKVLAESWNQSVNQTYYIYGMGLGYHIKALLETDDRNEVIVLENQTEVMCAALTYLDWQEYLENGRLCIVYEPDLMKLLKILKQRKQESVFFLHYPSLQCIEQKTVKETLEDYFVSVSSMQEQGVVLLKNFRHLQEANLPECGVLRERFAGKNVVIAAGGPSIDDEIEALHKYRKELFIFSVGTVSRKLIRNGILPDAIMITDPQENMYQQIEGIDAREIPLIVLSTVDKSILDHYNGPVYLAYQQEFELAERVAGENGYMLFETGGSVTTTALDIAISFGAQKIILVGADMAYTDNQSHASGLGREIKDVSELRQVRAVGGGIVYTSRNLDIYRKWIERRIAELRYPLVYNTSRGAKIEGTIEQSIETLMKA